MDIEGEVNNLNPVLNGLHTDFPPIGKVSNGGQFFVRRGFHASKLPHRILLVRAMEI
jgi:hypothetical protein